MLFQPMKKETNRKGIINMVSCFHSEKQSNGKERHYKPACFLKGFFDISSELFVRVDDPVRAGFNPPLLPEFIQYNPLFDPRVVVEGVGKVLPVLTIFKLVNVGIGSCCCPPGMREEVELRVALEPPVRCVGTQAKVYPLAWGCTVTAVPSCGFTAIA